MPTDADGVFLTFYDPGDGPGTELPAVGSFEDLVVRHGHLLGDRRTVDHGDASPESVGRWLEAELELQRALGQEPGGVRRSHLRIRAPGRDLLLRFFDFGGDAPPAVPPLGPFSVVTVGPREVRADDKLIAIRVVDIAPWTLTAAVRSGVAGVHKADIGVSMASRIPAAPGPIAAPQPAGPPAADSAAPAAREPAIPAIPAIQVARPAPQEETTPADRALAESIERLRRDRLTQDLLVERLRRDQGVEPEAQISAAVRGPEIRSMRFQRPADRPDEPERDKPPFDLGATLWSLRLVIIALLVVGLGFAGWRYASGGGGGSGPARIVTVDVGDPVTVPHWVYIVRSAERVDALGSVPPRGQYVIVWITAARRDDHDPGVLPGDFAVLTAEGGQELPAQATGGTVYEPLANRSRLVWPTDYPTGIPVRVPLVFDAPRGARGLRLFIRPASTMVRLPN